MEALRKGLPNKSIGFRRVQVKDLAEQSFGASAESGRGTRQTRTVLVVCSTFRDHRELPRLQRPGLDYLFHDYASTSLEELIGGRAEGLDGAADPIVEVARICAEIGDRAIAAVVSTDDYPGSALAAVLAKELGLPGPDPKVNLICQHKYWSRVAQARFAPEAVPPFWTIDVANNADLPGGIAFPVFVKTVKSFFSLGVVDSIFFPGTLAFSRFEYPSALPDGVQERMADIARRVMRGIGFDNGLFNIEMMYDAPNDRIAIIEINPRMASQFADLFEKVDGTNAYEILVDIGTDVRPTPKRRRGPYQFAASCVLRTFQDCVVAALPST